MFKRQHFDAMAIELKDGSKFLAFHNRPRHGMLTKLPLLLVMFSFLWSRPQIYVLSPQQLYHCSTRGHVSACSEAIKALVKHKVVMPEIPKHSNGKLSHLAFIAHSKIGKGIRSYMAKGRRLCHPKLKVQTKAEASAPPQAPKDAQTPMKAS